MKRPSECLVSFSLNISALIKLLQIEYNNLLNYFKLIFFQRGSFSQISLGYFWPQKVPFQYSYHTFGLDFIQIFSSLLSFIYFFLRIYINYNLCYLSFYFLFLFLCFSQYLGVNQNDLFSVRSCTRCVQFKETTKTNLPMS